MLSRKQQDKNATSLPKQWVDEATSGLTQRFPDQVLTSDKTFEVFGHLYPNEIVLIGSLVSTSDPGLSASSVFISADIEASVEEDSKVQKKRLDLLTDALGYVFDDFFAQDGDPDYDILWREEKIKNQTFYYKISRENVGLTIEANRLLSED